MAGFLNRTKSWRKALGPLTMSPHFWISQSAVVIIAVAHALSEGYELLTDNPLEFVPISFVWVPIMYVAIKFGLAGSIITTALTVLANLPNWIYMDRSERRWEEIAIEIAIVIGAAAISFLIGWQVDRRIEAQRNARIYAANAVRSQEEERRQLSLDLHDDSIQTLISICHTLDSLRDVSSSAHDSLVEIRSSISGTVDKLRHLSVALRPPILDDMGVVSALRSLITESAAKAGFAGELKIQGETRRLPPDTELGLFRIAQEALNNIVRHARAVRVRVRITFDAKDIVLEIVDDGVGFDISVLPGQIGENHIGLLSMQERAEMLGGRLTLNSEPGKGTTVKAVIPITKG